MIALYLLSNQYRYSEGFYRLPLSYIAEDMRLEQKEILKAVQKLNDSPALAQALTPTQAQTPAQIKTNVGQKEDLIFLNQEFKNNNLKPEEELCCYLIELIEKNNPRALLPKKEASDPLFKKWAKEIERFKRLGPVGAKEEEKENGEK